MTGGFDGPIGWLAAKAMARMNAAAEEEAVDLLASAPGERLLVIGFGPGVGLEMLARRRTDTIITGIDPSAAMLRSAARRNRVTLSSGRMTLYQTTIAGLDPAACNFDGAVAVNTLQFFEPLEDTALALAERLRPAGRFVSLTHDWALARRAGSVDAFVAGAKSAFSRAGFNDITYTRGRAERGRVAVFCATRGD